MIENMSNGTRIGCKEHNTHIGWIGEAVEGELLTSAALSTTEQGRPKCLMAVS